MDPAELPQQQAVCASGTPADDQVSLASVSTDDTDEDMSADEEAPDWHAVCVND